MIEDRDLRVGDIVQHFKRELAENMGNLYLYKILGLAKHTETGEMLVIYQALYESKELGIFYDIFARPYEMFVGKVDKEKYPDVRQEYRFEKHYFN